MSIAEANELCAAIPHQEGINEIGEAKVSITGRMLFIEDTGKTAASLGYLTTNPYKAFIYDETGYIYVGVDMTSYNQLSKYEFQETSYYTFEGTVNRYLDQNEIIVDAYVWEKDFPATYELSLLADFVAEEKDLPTVYEEMKGLRINHAGTRYGDLVAIKAKYIQKAENTNLLFANGDNILNLHGYDKIGNSFSLGSSYLIYATYNMFRYRPGLEWCYAVKLSEDIEVDCTKAEVMTPSDVYSYAWTKDSNKHQAQYEAFFTKFHAVKAYASYYQKNGRFSMCVTTSYVPDGYSSYNSAYMAKAVFANNSSEVNKSESELQLYSFLYPYWNSGEQFEMPFAPYALNTSNYWQVNFIV